MNKAQKNTVNWLIEQAKRSFEEFNNINDWDFITEIEENEYGVSLVIAKRAKENTNLLCLLNKNYLIFIGKRGAVNKAIDVNKDKSDRYIKKGIFAL